MTLCKALAESRKKKKDKKNTYIPMTFYIKCCNKELGKEDPSYLYKCFRIGLT